MVNVVTLQANGNKYDNLLSFRITKNIEDLSGTFEVMATSTDTYSDNPIEPQDPVVIAVDDEPVISGFADEVEISYSPDGHTIKIVGRDKTADFIDSTLDAKTFNPPIGFEQLLTKLLTFVGYTVVSPNKKLGLGLALGQNQISIINNYGTIAPFTTAEGIQLRHSESAYNLIKRCAERRQIILNSDGGGNIVIAKIGDVEAFTILQNIDSDSSTGNNIKNARVRRSFQDRFYRYTVKSMTTTGTDAGGSNFDGNDAVDPLSNNATPQSGAAIDPDIRPSRILTLIGSTALTSSDCKNRAEWEANIRKTKGFTYECEVFGLRQNLDSNLAVNPLWWPNQVVYVIDEFAGLDNEFLIKSIEFNQDLNAGTTTKLQLVEKDSYSTSIFEPLLRKKVDNEVSKSLLPGTEA